MATQYPDITDWENLNKYADLFKTSESGGKGQLLDGDPSFVTNDAALVTNLKLNYKVVYAGSETALIQAFRTGGGQHKSRCSATSTSRSGCSSEVKLVRVTLPPYTPGCDADAAKVACDYPHYTLNKVVSSEVRRLRQPGGRGGEELHLDQRRSERGRPRHRRAEHETRRRRQEVARRQPRQVESLARLETG